MNSSIPADYTPAPQLLSGYNLLITGAGDGLGRAAALACARHGATVVLLGRTVAKLEKTYDAIEQAGGPKPAIYPLNLVGASWNDYSELAATLEREMGRLHGLLHCAAHFKQFAPLSMTEPREWMESLQVNLTAAWSLTRHCLPLMAPGPQSSVVFVSDSAGRSAKPFQGAYGISKAALENLARMWALEMPDGPRFNSFNPGPLRTGLRLKGYPGETLEQSPLPETACKSLLWLLGPDSGTITGASL